MQLLSHSLWLKTLISAVCEIGPALWWKAFKKDLVYYVLNYFEKIPRISHTTFECFKGLVYTVCR